MDLVVFSVVLVFAVFGAFVLSIIAVVGEEQRIQTAYARKIQPAPAPEQLTAAGPAPVVPVEPAPTPVVPVRPAFIAVAPAKEIRTEHAFYPSP